MAGEDGASGDGIRHGLGEPGVAAPHSYSYTPKKDHA